jgi:hypothetical protein
MRVLSMCVLAAACGHAPPPKPPPAELPVKTAADIAGTWVASDDMDWGYHLTIDKDGKLDQIIDRGRLGRCEQKGTLAPAAANELAITYSKNECNQQYDGGAVQMKVTSFTGDALAVTLVGYGIEERHAYKHAPAQ